MIRLRNSAQTPRKIAKNGPSSVRETPRPRSRRYQAAGAHDDRHHAEDQKDDRRWVVARPAGCELHGQRSYRRTARGDPFAVNDRQDGCLKSRARSASTPWPCVVRSDRGGSCTRLPYMPPTLKPKYGPQWQQPEPQDRTDGAHRHKDHNQYPLVRPGRRVDRSTVARIERPHLVTDLCRRRWAALEQHIGPDERPVVAGEVAVHDACLVAVARGDLEGARSSHAVCGSNCGSEVYRAEPECRRYGQGNHDQDDEASEDSRGTSVPTLPPCPEATIRLHDHQGTGRVKVMDLWIQRQSVKASLRLIGLSPARSPSTPPRRKQAATRTVRPQSRSALAAQGWPRTGASPSPVPGPRAGRPGQGGAGGAPHRTTDLGGLPHHPAPVAAL
jgi:hypothetical protein